MSRVADKTARKKVAAVITGADHPTGLGTARALKGEGATLIGFCSNPGSRYCTSNSWDQIITVDSNEEALLKAIIKLGRSSDFEQMLLFPSQDEFVELVSAHREELERYYEFVLPERESINLLLNKALFYPWARGNGYPVPESHIVSTREELEKVLSDMKFPVILKTALRTREWDKHSPLEKVITLNKRDDISDIGFDIFSVSKKYLVQQWIPGKDKNIFFCLIYFDRNGRELGHFTGRKLVQWPLNNGSTAACVSAPDDVIYPLAREVLMSAGMKGLGSLEVKLNELDRRYYIIEPTVGRNDLQSYLAVAGGINLTSMAFKDAIGEKVETEDNRREAAWIDENGLLEAFLAAPGKKQILELLQRQVRGKKISFSHFCVSDIKPFLSLSKNLFTSKIKSSMRNISKNGAACSSKKY